MALPDWQGAISPVIDSAELAGRLRSNQAPLIIDVREPDEFAAGHIPGAENLPLSRFTREFQRLDPNTEIALVCRSGNRSGAAQQFLISQGYSATRNLVGGMLDWFGPVA